MTTKFFFYDKKIIKSASVLSCCVVSPTPSPSPLLNFFFSHPASLFVDDLWVYSPPSSISHHLPATLIHSVPQRRLIYLLSCFVFSSPHVVQKPSGQKEERTGSIAASRGRRGWTSSIFVFTLPPPGRRRREERMKS